MCAAAGTRSSSTRSVRAGQVGGYLDRRRPTPQGAGEEPAGRRSIPVLGQQHVDDLAVLVDRPVQVPPAAGHLDVGLVHEPAVAGGVPERSGGVGEQRGEPLPHRYTVTWSTSTPRSA